MPPEKIPEMLSSLRHCDIVIGTRFVKGGKDERVARALVSRFINILASFILGGGISDYTSGFIVAKKKALNGVKFDGPHGAYFMRLLYQARKKGYKICEVPYTFSPRGYGSSKIDSPWKFLSGGFGYAVYLIYTRLGF